MNYFFSHYLGNGGVVLGAVSVLFFDFGIRMVCKKRLGSVSAAGLIGGALTVSIAALFSFDPSVFFRVGRVEARA